MQDFTLTAPHIHKQPHSRTLVTNIFGHSVWFSSHPATTSDRDPMRPWSTWTIGFWSSKGQSLTQNIFLWNSSMPIFITELVLLIKTPPFYEVNSFNRRATPPLWPDLVKIWTRKRRHASSFSLECTDFKNVIFEKIHWAHSEDTEVAEVKRPRNSKRWKF